MSTNPYTFFAAFSAAPTDTQLEQMRAEIGDALGRLVQASATKQITTQTIAEFRTTADALASVLPRTDLNKAVEKVARFSGNVDLAILNAPNRTSAPITRSGLTTGQKWAIGVGATSIGLFLLYMIGKYDRGLSGQKLSGGIRHYQALENMIGAIDYARRQADFLLGVEGDLVLEDSFHDFINILDEARSKAKWFAGRLYEKD